MEINGNFVPSTIVENLPIYFAIDNADLTVDTPDAKRQLRGTGTAMYRGKSISKQAYITFLPLPKSSRV